MGVADVEYDFASCTAPLQQGVGFGNFIESEHLAVQRADVCPGDEAEQLVDDLPGGIVAEEAREKHPVGDLLDSLNSQLNYLL